MADNIEKLGQWGRVIQLIVALSCLVVPWMVYPGVMALIPVAVACVYTILAIYRSTVATWSALSISLFVSLIFAAGVERFISGGYSYIEGDWPQRHIRADPAIPLAQDDRGIWKVDEFVTRTGAPTRENYRRLLPYAFLLIAILAVIVLLLQMLGWYRQYRDS